MAMIKFTPDLVERAALMFLKTGSMEPRHLREIGVMVKIDTKHQSKITEEAGRIASRWLRRIPAVTYEYRGEYR